MQKLSAAFLVLTYYHVKNILKEFWQPHLQGITCPNRTSVRWSCEHVIPRSLVRNTEFSRIETDLRNLIIFPQHLNNVRSNLKYGNVVKNATVKYYCECKVPSTNCSFTAVTSKQKNQTIFCPPDIFKGKIARSVLSVIALYPDITPRVNKRVLNLRVARQWNKTFPPDSDEKNWITILKTTTPR